jgi:hypothetical protein
MCSGTVDPHSGRRARRSRSLTMGRVVGVDRTLGPRLESMTVEQVISLVSMSAKPIMHVIEVWA